MANVKGGNGIKNATEQQNQPGKALAQSLKAMVANPNTKKHFEQMLGKHSGAFLGSIVTLANANANLRACHPATIMGGAVKAASLGFSLDPAIGQCYLVPYGSVATFQIGYKGLIELFQRSGKAKSCRMFPVYEGEIRDWNKFTETFTPGERVSDVVVGYYAAFELTNGFSKAEYWSKDAVVKFAKEKSKSFGNGPWQTDFDAMACKTVMKHILSIYAPKSIEMNQALAADDKAFSTEENTDVVDMEEPIDIEFADAVEE